MRRSLLVCALLLGAVAAPAGAAGGFTDYRQAASDQYGSRSQAPSSTTESSQGAGQQTGSGVQGSAVRPRRPGGKRRNPIPGERTRVLGAHAERGRAAAPLVVAARPSAPAPAPRGSLPFTGGALGIVTLVALAALAAGLLGAAALRITRRSTPQRT